MSWTSLGSFCPPSLGSALSSELSASAASAASALRSVAPTVTGQESLLVPHQAGGLESAWGRSSWLGQFLGVTYSDLHSELIKNRSESNKTMPHTWHVPSLEDLLIKHQLTLTERPPPHRLPPSYPPLRSSQPSMATRTAHFCCFSTQPFAVKKETQPLRLKRLWSHTKPVPHATWFFITRSWASRIKSQCLTIRFGIGFPSLPHRFAVPSNVFSWKPNPSQTFPIDSSCSS